MFYQWTLEQFIAKKTLNETQNSYQSNARYFDMKIFCKFSNNFCKTFIGLITLMWSTLIDDINMIYFRWWWWWRWWFFLRYGWPTKDVSPLSEILTTANLRYAASRIWTCAQPEFRLSWMITMLQTSRWLYSVHNSPFFETLVYVCQFVIASNCICIVRNLSNNVVAWIIDMSIHRFIFVTSLSEISAFLSKLL